MTTIKLKVDDVEMPKCCEECPFLGDIEMKDEWGESLCYCSLYCGLTGDDVGFSNDPEYGDRKLENCPIISVEHE